MTDRAKLVIIATHGPADPELATIPFVMADAALATDIDVSVIFQADAVCLAMPGEASTVQAAAFPPLVKLMDDFHQLGGALLVCTPCMKARNLDPDTAVAGGELIAAGRVIAEVSSATNCLTY